MHVGNSAQQISKKTRTAASNNIELVHSLPTADNAQLQFRLWSKSPTWYTKHSQKTHVAKDESYYPFFACGIYILYEQLHTPENTGPIGYVAVHSMLWNHVAILYTFHLGGSTILASLALKAVLLLIFLQVSLRIMGK